MPAKFENINVDVAFLNNNPNVFFVFGDDDKGKKANVDPGIRSHNKAVRFIVKKEKSCFKPEEYAKLFFDQLKQLVDAVKKNSTYKFYISKIGADADKYYIWNKLIHHNLVGELEIFDNVVFCWELESLNK
jgi:hypothetical protein